MSWRAIRHATVETRIEQIKCFKDSGMKDSGKNSTLPQSSNPVSQTYHNDLN